MPAPQATPVIRCETERTEVNSGLYTVKCGDKGLLRR
jgi:hypothetical protein